MTDEITDSLEAVRRDIIALATAVKAINDYGQRLGNVESLCSTILAPSADEASAQEDLAHILASKAKRGGIVSIVADWDEQWHFLFQFRYTDGYTHADGFDLREGKPGYTALLKALESFKVSPSICDLRPPEQAGIVPMRRVIYPIVKPAEAETK